MIQIQDVTFSYTDKNKKVFERFCLQLEQNKVYGLLGENGIAAALPVGEAVSVLVAIYLLRRWISRHSEASV